MPSPTLTNVQGRPRTPLNWDDIGRQCSLGMSASDIADIYGCSKETIYDRCKADLNITFTEFSREHKKKVDNMLLQTQLDKALVQKDNVMLLWLGKQRLGQSDNPKETEKAKSDYVDFKKQFKVTNG